MLPACVALALALGLSAGGCNRSSSEQPPAGSTAARAPEPSTPAPALDAGAREMVAWLPADGAVAGWSRATEPRRFGPGNLWEYIDGAAEIYLAHSFQQLVTADYANAAAGLRVTVDLYRMDAPLGAFGIYAEERPPSPSFLAIGSEGYRHGNVLNFWAGTCYAKLTSPRDDPQVAAALEALGRDIAAKLGPAAARPAEFARFPASNLVPHSFKTVPKDVLGQSYLSGGFEAEYAEGGARYKVTLIPAATADDAAAAFAQYQSFAGGTSGTKPLKGLGDAAFSAQDGYYGLIVCARAGRSLGIVLGAPSEKAARSILSALL